MNSELLRIGAYLSTACVVLLGWRRETSQGRPDDPGLWPKMWLMTAILLLGFALARAVGAPNLITDIGRSEARSNGLYDARREFQAILIAGIALAWFAAVLVAVWRVPERRRRYLPAIVVVMAIVAFAAIRTVSFHYVDQILYNRPIYGIRGVVYVELGLLALLTATVAIRVLKLQSPARQGLFES